MKKNIFINRIVTDLKIKLINFKKLNLNKYMILALKNKNFFFLKISTDRYTSQLIKNELKGYKNNKIKLKFKHLPKFKIIDYKKNITAKIDYLGNKKGNYFSYKHFLNKTKIYKNNFVNINFYFQLILKNIFSFDKKIEEELIKYNKLIIKKFRIKKVQVDVSHGDFVHWNTMIYNSKYFVYDLEFFSEKRVYIFDQIHWYLAPLIQKIYTYKLKKLIEKKYIFSLLIFFIKKIFFNFLSKKTFYFYLTLYLIEKELYYKNLIILMSKKKNYQKDYFLRTKFFMKFNHELIKHITRKSF